MPASAASQKVAAFLRHQAEPTRLSVNTASSTAEPFRLSMMTGSKSTLSDRRWSRQIFVGVRFRRLLR